MYKNQLQELAQRSCFKLPSYTCIREGPDHAPRFKAQVNFNGEIFESSNFCSTLRQAEHCAAEVALSSLALRGPSHSLAARILDETGVYKNLLQEISQRVGAPLPQYTTYRSGLGRHLVFTGTVELAGIIFTGEPAKNKKQAEKNAALAAWSSLKQLAKEDASSSTEPETIDELEQITIARALLNYRRKEKIAMGNASYFPRLFPKKFLNQNPRATSPQPHSASTSKILPLIFPKTSTWSRPISTHTNDRIVPTKPSSLVISDRPITTRSPSTTATDSLITMRLASNTAIDRSILARPPSCTTVDWSVPAKSTSGTTTDDTLMPPQQEASLEHWMSCQQKYPGAGATPYIPMRQFATHCKGIAPPVTMRTAVPVFSAPPLPPPSALPPHVIHKAPMRIAPPVTIRQAVPVYAAPPIPRKDDTMKDPLAVQREDPLKTTKDPSIAPYVTVRQAVPVYAASPPSRKDDTLTDVKNLFAVQKEAPQKTQDDPSIAQASPSAIPNKLQAQVEETESTTMDKVQESNVVNILQQLEI